MAATVCSFEYRGSNAERTCTVHKDCKESCDLGYGSYGILFCNTHVCCNYICQSHRCENPEPAHMKTCVDCGETYCPHDNGRHDEECDEKPHDEAVSKVDESNGAFTVTVPAYDTRTCVFQCEACGREGHIDVPVTGRTFYITCHGCNTMFKSQI